MSNKKISIFHLSAFPYYTGGIDTWLFNMISSLDGKFDVVVYCPSPSDASKEPVYDLAPFRTTKVIYIGKFHSYPSMVIWAFHVFTYLFHRFDKASTVLVLSTIPSFFSVILLKIFGKIKGQIICSVRGQIARDAVEMAKSRLFQKAIKLVEGICLKFADCIIANGWDTQDYLREFYNLDSKVIPNGFKPRIFPDRSDYHDLSEFGQLKSQGIKIFVHVGTVRKVKCIDHILNAIALLNADTRSQAVFVFVGKGQIDHYKNLAEELGVPSFFIGERQNVKPYYLLADYVLNVSGGSGVSNSLIEALSFGKPVIAWDNKTFSQVITHGKNGILCSHLNTEKLSVAIEHVIKGRKFSEDEIRNSVSRFQWDNVVENWIELFKP